MKSEADKYLGGCEEARNDLGLSSECYSSCHYEFEDGYVQPLELYTTKGWYTVCCTVANEQAE